MKLEAESLIATAAALFAGLALTILDGKAVVYKSSNFTLPELTTMVVQVVTQSEATDAEQQQRNIIMLVSYLRVILLGFTTVANLYVLTIATTTRYLFCRNENFSQEQQELPRSQRSLREVLVNFRKSKASFSKFVCTLSTCVRVGCCSWFNRASSFFSFFSFCSFNSLCDLVRHSNCKKNDCWYYSG
jgi:hypothetical protein